MTLVYYKDSSSDEEACLLSSQSNGAHPVRLVYLNEGNANIIYRLTPLNEPTHFPAILEHKLLRLRKNKDFIQPTREQYTAYNQYFTSLFCPENLVEHTLLKVDQNIKLALNTTLQQLETSGQRPYSRHSDTLAVGEECGLLMTDMTPGPGEIFVELKPKWLVQSPDAPKTAMRCRTCALRAQRSAVKGKGVVLSGAGVFCPLALVLEDELERREAFKSVMVKGCDQSDEAAQNVISTLTKNVLPVLASLQSYQAKFDSEGILTKDPANIPENYLKAMTLRDCILLIKGSFSSSNTPFQARLADLDLKQAHPDKVAKWKKTEAMLIDEGWYMNTEVDRRQERVCLLSKRT